MNYGVTQELIDTYGEVIFKLSLNKQTRYGDPVRELDFDAIQEQRAGTGLTDEEIAKKIGLLPEQVSIVRVFVERKYHRIDLHRRLFHLGGGKRWKAAEYQHPEERLSIREDGMKLRESIRFDPDRASYYLENNYWTNETMIGWLNTHASDRPNSLSIISTDFTLTWLELKEEVDKLTNGLLGLGLKKGDVVALQLPNIKEFIVSYIAISAIGGVMQTIYMSHGEKDIEYFLNHSKARAIISPDHIKNFFVAEKLCNLRSSSDTLDQVIVVGDDIPDGAINYNDLLVEGVPDVGNPPVGSDPFLLLYTSGTTSNPKGVPLTYQNMLGHARLCAPEFGMTENDKILSVAPFCHLFGLYNYHCTFYAGAATVLLPTFSPPEFAKLVQKVSPTALFMGPAHAAAFREKDLLDSHDFSSVNYSVFSGAACPPDLLKWWKSQTGSLVCQLWGMTELAAGTFSRPDMDENIGFNSAGPVSPGNEIRVVSSESGEELSVGLEGELQIRGSSVFPGYFNNDGANKSAFTKDGWFKTGDLAKINEARCLEITGRTKDIINRGGVKYNPSDVEELIFSHPSVDMVSIVPMPDDVLGEKACCFVKLCEGKKLTLEALIQYLETKKMSKAKWPERLEIIDEMPLTPTRKIIKGRLLELLD